jgi:hypothetical protein
LKPASKDGAVAGDESSLLPDEAVGSGTRFPVGRAASPALGKRDRLGGTEGNEILTSATAALLTVLLIAEGITIIFIGRLRDPHMFIGLVLVPPVLLKLASTGYRFIRYYSGASSYLQKGPPLLALRLLAPLLVASTLAVFSTGIWLLILGHKSDQVLLLHKVVFFVWSGLFAIHFLAYLPRMLRSLGADWSPARRRAVPASGARGLLVAAAVASGLALALALLSAISGWHAGPPA